jgi:hypothetical protein
MAQRKRIDTLDDAEASYTAHYEASPNATQYRACRPETMVRIASHRYVSDTFLKMSGGLLASRHGVESTNGDEPGVKVGKRQKEAEMMVIRRILASASSYGIGARTCGPDDPSQRYLRPVIPPGRANRRCDTVG